MKVLPDLKQIRTPPLVLFSFVVFFISLHDGIISYITPVVLNSSFKNTLAVGSILSVSSFFGIFFNIFIAKYFHKKNYKFFASRMLFFALLVPVIYYLMPKTVLPFVLIMIIWSIYYELRNYSKYDFVNQFIESKRNAEAWSIMTMFQSTAYILGPIIAVLTIKQGLRLSLSASFIIVCAAVVIYCLFEKAYGKKEAKNIDTGSIRSVFKEMRIFKILARKVWPLVVFSFSLTLLDVSFWTIGVLYSEKLRTINEMGGFLLTFYCIPTVLVGIVAPKIYSSMGKKRTALISGLLAGLGLISLMFATNICLILGLVFVTASFSNISFILIFATFEDYITRLDGEGNNLVGINEISQNAAYAVGPIFLGFLSRNGNFRISFLVTGVMLSLVSILALSVIPRKIRMPHKELAKELEQ